MPEVLIRIAHASCPTPATFADTDVAVGFLRAMSAQITAADFVALVRLKHGPAFVDTARAFIEACLGVPL